MRIWRVLPFLALAAVFVSLLVTGMWHERLTTPELAPYESPCVISWRENQFTGGGPTTMCVLTEKAARLERALGKTNPPA